MSPVRESSTGGSCRERPITHGWALLMGPHTHQHTPRACVSHQRWLLGVCRWRLDMAATHPGAQQQGDARGDDGSLTHTARSERPAWPCTNNPSQAFPHLKLSVIKPLIPLRSVQARVSASLAPKQIQFSFSSNSCTVLCKCIIYGAPSATNGGVEADSRPSLSGTFPEFS